MSLDKNNISLTGTLITDFKPFNDTEYLYVATLKVKRLSENSDYIPIVISKVKWEKHQQILQCDKRVSVEGDCCMTNNKLKSHPKQLLYVNVQTLKEVSDTEHDYNQVLLSATLCNNPILHGTSKKRLSSSEIANNSRRNKPLYMICLFWGYYSHLASESFHVGTKIFIKGRIQSREYKKDNQKYTAYEISVMKLL